MHSDPHALFQGKIDEALAAEPSAQQDPSLREHLNSCALCQDYLESNLRVIASLGAFSFEVDPQLNQRVYEALDLRSQQLKRSPLSRKRLTWACAVAVLLTITGSFFDLQLGHVLALLFGTPGHLRQDVLTFWVVPSLLPLLLFPLLPLLAMRKERAV